MQKVITTVGNVVSGSARAKETLEWLSNDIFGKVVQLKKGVTIDREEAKLSWLRQILEWQRDMSDNREFVSLLKNDLNLFSDTVFCFTPSGDVKNLPAGSTPIDFAYSIHSAVGNKMVGAKVNGKLVPIDYRIKNGDRIEIITSQNSRVFSPVSQFIVHTPDLPFSVKYTFAVLLPR